MLNIVTLAVLCLSQILLNFFEYLYYKILTGYKINKVNAHYRRKIAASPDNADQLRMQ